MTLSSIWTYSLESTAWLCAHEAQGCAVSAYFMIQKLFFQLIRVAIGTQDTLTRAPSAEEWKLLYDMAKKQSLVGICFAGVQRLNSLYPSLLSQLPEVLYLQWMGMAAKIQQKNEGVTKDVASVREHFQQQGMDMVLLKGQGNLCNYPENLRGLRTPGDIDAWVMPKGFGDMPLKERMKNDEWFLRWLWKKDKSIRHCYIHVVYPQIVQSEVEVHFRPSYLNSPIRNRWFQKWMMEEAPKQVANKVKLPTNSDEKVEVAVPTAEFNVVYQLSHLYRHIFDDGLGLRQILDYYFVLRAADKECFKVSSFDSAQEPSSKLQEVSDLIESFGMKKFARALMYVLQSHLGLDEKYLLCEPDEEAGKFLLDEIMTAGNFGQYDERERVAKHENGVQRLLRRQKRNMRFFGQYAEEVMCVPVYRVYQEWWRLKMNWKCK